MKFRVPFTFASIDKLKKRSLFLKKFVHYKKDSLLSERLKLIDSGVTREEYLAICLQGAFISFLIVFFISSSLLFLAGVNKVIIYSLALAFLFPSFLFFTRILYPGVYSSRKQMEIERNLIPALQDMLVQLNSGVPLFSILVNISSSDYGALGEEFKKIVRKINAGLSQVDVLEESGEKNPSMFYRRALWQVSNGMRSGGDVSIVIKDSISSLRKEQLIQIQNYGNKLSPAIVFYMLVSVILPALSITFLTIISSLVNLSGFITTVLFIGLFVFVIFIQLMFLGVIKSIRPSLL